MYTYFVTYSMEDNVKKIILLLTLCLTITFLVGCSCEKKEKNGGNDLMPVKDLYTSDSKLVYDNAGIFKLVFEFKNDEVTSCEHYYEYESEEDAKKHYEEDKENLKDNATIKNITLNGKYVIYTISDTEWAGLKREDVEKKYSYLIPVYE